MTDRCPLLLKYKERHCYSCLEWNFNSDDSNQHHYDGQEKEMWKIRMPDDPNYLANSDGYILHFYRSEIYSSGAADPIIITFSRGSLSTTYGDIDRSFIISHNHGAAHKITHDEYRNGAQDKILQEYERCRTDWQTRIIIMGA